MKNLTIITLDQANITDFAAARNAQLAKAKTEWVLFLDKDETISKELEQEILQAVSSRLYAYDAYYLKRQDMFLGRELKHGETGHAKFIRLAKKDFGKWERPVHEVWVPARSAYSTAVAGGGQGRVGTLNNPLIHHSHATIASFLDKINRYSTIEAQYRFVQGIKSSLWKIAIYPLAKFKWNYFCHLGFLDGVPGTIMAIMMSFHSYLTWTKLYLLWHKK